MARHFSLGPPPDKVRSALSGKRSAWSVRIPRGARATLLAGRVPMLWVSVLAEVTLLLVALVPQSVWAGYGYPTGPIPNVLSPLVAALFYLLPMVTGALCRRWYTAIVLATFPAWLDLGVFAITAAKRIGPFYLAQDPHTVNTVSTLELFGLLGIFGWLIRSWLLPVSGTDEQ